MRSKRELPFSCATNAGNPERARFSSWPLVKPLRPCFCEEELGPSPSRPYQLLRAFIWLKRWPFCPSQHGSCACSDCLALDCTELTWLGKPRCLYGEKLTRLVRVASRFFGIRVLKANSELKVCEGDGIPEITLGITGLHKIVSGLRNWNRSQICPKRIDIVARLYSIFISRHFLQFFHLTGLQYSRFFNFFFQNQFSRREEPA